MFRNTFGSVGCLDCTIFCVILVANMGCGDVSMMPVSAAPTQCSLDAMFDEVLNAYPGAFDAADSSSMILGGAVFDSVVAEEVRDTVVAEEVADSVVAEEVADTVVVEDEVGDTVGGVADSFVAEAVADMGAILIFPNEGEP